MLAKAAALWVVGLLTLVPCATYHLLYEAPREQYALLITLVLFWVFGYWGTVGPLLALFKVRSVVRALEAARTRDDLLEALRSPETRELAIDLIASENRIPRVLAARIHRLLADRLSERIGEKGRLPP